MLASEFIPVALSSPPYHLEVLLEAGSSEPLLWRKMLRLLLHQGKWTERELAEQLGA